ncbi:helix-turn-helix protein [Aneurinibacillus soli]|uniref:Capsule biosynthesis protein CapA n=1 Tax=Aneurinibacillus soli TaxID=1500254 RepID=A0A0U5AU62_9BACL|nr:CapA family protein [Aneurinibacillus soli]PYE60319.1 helix-turn-helix protein [Aneurinibacillus soli]BAU27281.1 Capsule biosynthesis protein CapA [Aneurinibacillus soli]
MNNEMTAIVEKMREFRLDAGITLQEIEQGTGISIQRLKRIEKGASPLTVEEMEELLSFYQLDANEVLSYGSLQAQKVQKQSRLTKGVIWAAILVVAGYGGYQGYQVFTAGKAAVAVTDAVPAVAKEEKVNDLLSSQKSVAKPTAESKKAAAIKAQPALFRLAVSGDTAYRSASVRPVAGTDFHLIPVYGFTPGGDIPAWLTQTAKNGAAGIDIANSDVLAGKAREQVTAEVKRLRSQNIPVLGFGTQAEAFAPYIREKNGTKYGMLAFSRIVPSVDWKAEAGQAGVADAYGTHILDDIRRAKKQADVVVVNMFWGASDSTTPERYQKDMAQELIDAGADVIIGHRAQSVQPYEVYKGKYVFYNIGSQQLELGFDGKTLKEAALVNGSNKKIIAIQK